MRLPLVVLAGALCVSLCSCDALVDSKSLEQELATAADAGADAAAEPDLPVDAGPDLPEPDSAATDEISTDDLIPDETTGDAADGTTDLDGTQTDTGWECPGPVFEEEIQKVVTLAFGKGGLAGEALDIDDNPETCSPVGQCEGGLNNQLSGLVGQMEQFVDSGSELEKALDEGELVLLLEPVSPALDGSTFVLNLLLGETTATKEECDWQTDACAYLVIPDSLAPGTCAPRFHFDNTTIVDGQLRAGGPDAEFAMVVPLSDSFRLEIVVHMARIEGTVVGTDEIEGIVGGIVGGAVRKSSLLEAIDSIPPELVETLPVSPEMVKNLLDAFIVPDVDINGDGELDGASVGLKFSTIPGSVGGMGL